MNDSLRHDRVFMSFAFAPLSLTLWEESSPFATSFADYPAGSWLLAMSIGCSLLLGGVLTRLAKTLVEKAVHGGGDGHTDLPTTVACVEKRAKPTLVGSDDRAKLVQRFLDQGRTAILLRPQIARTLEPEHFAVIRQTFQEEAVLVSAGEVTLTEWTFEESEPAPNQAVKKRFDVEAFYLDRFAVTNRQFREFIADGGYAQQSLWDAAIWPRVNEFVDRTGAAAPRFWNNGLYTPGEEELPVVGVSWYEADAFARWAGRRLPTDAEWVKAAVSPTTSVGQEILPKKFPWGDNFDQQRANLWISGSARPVEVTRYQSTPPKNEMVQLIGNVWEWTAGDTRITSYGRDVRFEVPLKSLRGGAFDTYFENQTTSQLQSGDSPLARRRNIGFRCGLSAAEAIEFGGQA